MKKQSIYFLVIIILLVQTSCQQNNNEEDLFNNKITLLENNPQLYLSKVDSIQVTNLNDEKEATHFLLVSLANHYINNYYPHKELLQKRKKLKNGGASYRKSYRYSKPNRG